MNMNFFFAWVIDSRILAPPIILHNFKIRVVLVENHVQPVIFLTAPLSSYGSLKNRDWYMSSSPV